MGTDHHNPRCLNCRRGTVRAKGLCQGCLTIRSLWSQYNVGPLDCDDFFGTLPVAPQPTDATPGSEAKIQVMAARFAAGHHLHHPRDAPRDDTAIPTAEVLDVAPEPRRGRPPGRLYAPDARDANQSRTPRIVRCHLPQEVSP